MIYFDSIVRTNIVVDSSQSNFKIVTFLSFCKPKLLIEKQFKATNLMLFVIEHNFKIIRIDSAVYCWALLPLSKRDSKIPFINE